MASLQNTTVTGTLSVSGDITAANLNFIPTGLIAMWSGSTSAVPSGWALCNGANGTPNLQDRFIVGAGSSYAVGATGGATSASFSGTTGATTLTTTQMPSHTHVETPQWTGSYGQNKPGYSTTNTNLVNVNTGATGGSGSHTHSMSGSVDTRSPYYALAYIMKL